LRFFALTDEAFSEVGLVSLQGRRRSNELWRPKPYSHFRVQKIQYTGK